MNAKDLNERCRAVAALGIPRAVAEERAGQFLAAMNRAFDALPDDQKAALYRKARRAERRQKIRDLFAPIHRLLGL